MMGAEYQPRVGSGPGDGHPCALRGHPYVHGVDEQGGTAEVHHYPAPVYPSPVMLCGQRVGRLMYANHYHVGGRVNEEAEVPFPTPLDEGEGTALDYVDEQRDARDDQNGIQYQQRLTEQNPESATVHSREYPVEARDGQVLLEKGLHQ